MNQNGQNQPKWAKIRGGNVFTCVVQFGQWPKLKLFSYYGQTKTKLIAVGHTQDPSQTSITISTGLEIIMSQNDVRKLHKLFSILIKSAMQPKCIIGSNQSVQPYHFGKMVQEILLDPQGIKTENWKMIGMSHAFVLLYNHLP